MPYIRVSTSKPATAEQEVALQAGLDVESVNLTFACFSGWGTHGTLLGR